jgi:hypothetical protein
MTNESSNEKTVPPAESIESRRLFLRSIGKWSGAAIVAAVAGGAWLASSPEAEAGGWVNRRGVRGGGWINRGGGGGGWINRRGGVGGWINGRGGGGGGWVNRW